MNTYFTRRRFLPHHPLERSHSRQYFFSTATEFKCSTGCRFEFFFFFSGVLSTEWYDACGVLYARAANFLPVPLLCGLLMNSRRASPRPNELALSNRISIWLAHGFNGHCYYCGSLAYAYCCTHVRSPPYTSCIPRARVRSKVPVRRTLPEIMYLLPFGENLSSTISLTGSFSIQKRTHKHTRAYTGSVRGAIFEPRSPPPFWTP